MRVVVGRHKYEREAGCRGGRCRQEIWVTWFTGRDTLGRMHRLWGARGVGVWSDTLCPLQDDHFCCYCSFFSFIPPCFDMLCFIMKWCLADSFFQAAPFFGRRGCLTVMCFYGCRESKIGTELMGTLVSILTVTFCNSDAVVSRAGSALRVYSYTNYCHICGVFSRHSFISLCLSVCIW